MSIEGLEQAIEWMGDPDSWEEPEAHTVIDVLRRVANGRAVQWCTRHISPASFDAEECVVKAEWGRRHDCVIVNAIVLTGDTG